MKAFTKIILGVIYFLGIFYLVLPNPVYPDLSFSSRSDEPGDTWQHLDQKAFYTQTERSDVLSELENAFALRQFSLVAPSFRLNYRPEETTFFVREQVDSSYLEEIVHPLRESLFVSGWEPQNSPRWQDLPYEERPRIEKYNQEFHAKITLRLSSSSVWARILIWSLIFPASYFVFMSINKTLAKNE